jgi:hypothetical protein
MSAAAVCFPYRSPLSCRPFLMHAGSGTASCVAIGNLERDNVDRDKLGKTRRVAAATSSVLHSSGTRPFRVLVALTGIGSRGLA